VPKEIQFLFFQDSIKLLNVSSFKLYPQNINLFMKFISKYVLHYPKELFIEFLTFLFSAIPSDSHHLVNSLDFSILSDCFPSPFNPPPQFKFSDVQHIFMDHSTVILFISCLDCPLELRKIISSLFAGKAQIIP
jgi:hypothetical protein